MSQQRILIVLDSGAFQGANITTDTGSPVPLDLTALAALLPDLNAAAILAADAGQSAVASLAAKDAEIATLTAALGLTDEQLDAMFTQAASLEV